MSKYEVVRVESGGILRLEGGHLRYIPAVEEARNLKIRFPHREYSVIEVHLGAEDIRYHAEEHLRRRRE